jgi:hypothetical protein
MIPVTRGNHKLPNTTAVFNITPAETCPSRALGLCQLSKCGVGADKCYALKAERTYGRPHTLLHRMEQQAWWDEYLGLALGCQLSRWIKDRKTPITAVRVNESGDFRHQHDVDKLGAVARVLKEDHPKVVIYCYTARKDLAFCGLTENVVVNGSGFMVHNRYVILAGLNAGMKVDWMCEGDCRKCRRCLRRSGLTIGNRLH